ncbi:MAG: arginase family protein [Bryobacterales bacterium]|nr:arginase family protein [Bryobacterales bacterium]
MYTLIEVPFHLGLEEVAVGKGPRQLLASGLDQLLGTGGMPALVSHVRLRDLRSQGPDSIVDVNRVVKHAVQQAVEEETVPVVVAGNCNSAIGVIAGLETPRLGIVWFDRHPDFHTPESSISGNIEGMTLSVLTGHCHQELRERIGMERLVSEHDVILACFWDVEEGEKERLEDSWISAHPVDSLGLLPVALDQLKQRVDAVYLHIDTDFLEGVENPARYIALVCETLPIAAVGVTNYNPDLDTAGLWKKEIWKALESLRPRVH